MSDPLPEPPAGPETPAPPAGEPALRGERFAEGDPIEFLQFGKARPFYATLRPSRTANVRGHRFPHAELIGREVGSALRSPQGELFFLVRPSLARWVEAMPRFAKTVYPKEVGPLLLYADVFPGARVLEAGLGSAGLTLFLLRALGPQGLLVSYELREGSIRQGTSNVAGWLGAAPPQHQVRKGDVYEGIAERDLDRILLDLPEPWRVVPHALEALRPGGILAAFLPTILQVHELTNALKDTGAFPDVETIETLQRRWMVGRRSVRPDAMSNANGFVVVGRYARPEQAVEASP